MSRFSVNGKCTGCLACVQNCPARALDYEDEGDVRTLRHNLGRCARCATCWRVCPEQAIEFQHLLEGGWDEVVALPLVRCSACGQPLRTERVPGSVPENLVDLTEPLCDQHRMRRSARQGQGGVP